MHINPIRALTDNFRNLLMTNHGERLGKFDFGANLNSVVFEYSNSPNFEQLVSDAVINTTQKFIPAISITGVSTAITDISEKNDLNKLGLAKVTIRVEYIIPKFKSPNLAIEIDLNYTEAYYNLGILYHKQEKIELAKRCYEKTLKLDPSFCEAHHILNALSGKTTKSAPKKYVEKLFDNYAANFEKSLVLNLKYNTPKIIKEMIIDNNMEQSLSV